MQKNRSVCSKKRQIPRHLYYIATMVPYGKETEQKILRHRQMRNGKGFETLECFTDLKKMVQTEPGFRADAAEEGICVLLECMSNLTANELYLDTRCKRSDQGSRSGRNPGIRKTLPGTCGSHK